MLLKTKKFFQKTLGNLKSFLSGGYQRLPKTPPFGPFSRVEDLNMSFGALHDEKTTPRPVFKVDDHHALNENAGKMDQKATKKKKRKNVYKGRINEEDSSSLKVRRENRNRSVEKKLKELEKMDFSNAEHVLDIEEILHYYTRLTCPAYVDIVDKFFMEICSEFSSSLQQSDIGVANSRPRLKPGK